MVSSVGVPQLRAAAYAIIGLTWAVLFAVMLWRGAAAGIDAHAYWLGSRTWLAGGDPYTGTCPLCYAYAPWAVPIFAPWALLPWPLAFVVWRLATVAGLAWSTVWAARRRPILTAIAFAALSVPMGINLDTGNITLPLVLLMWAARGMGPAAVGIAWGLATGLKWITAPLWLVLSPVARRAGLAALAATALADLLLWRGTLRQVLTVANMDRPLPFDYLVLLWAVVPWAWSDRSFVRTSLLRGRLWWRWSRRRVRRSAQTWMRGG